MYISPVSNLVFNSNKYNHICKIKQNNLNDHTENTHKESINKQRISTEFLDCFFGKQRRVGTNIIGYFDPSTLAKGQMLDGYGEIFIRHTTRFFREDINWIDFGKYLHEAFSNTEGLIGTYIYGCSSGEEAYSMALLLDYYFNGDKNFSKIEAKDISQSIIQSNKLRQKKALNVTGASSKIYNTFGMDDLWIKSILKINPENKSILLSNRIKNFVSFNCANILTDIDSICATRPAIIMMRNMWPYIDDKYHDEYAKKLYEKLYQGSIVVIGDYDYSKEGKNKNIFPHSLLKAGFIPLDKSSHWGKEQKPKVFIKK